MPTSAIAQWRMTDLAGTIGFGAEVVGPRLAAAREDVDAGLRARQRPVHLRRVEAPDRSIPHVAAGEHLHLDPARASARGFAAAKGVAFVRPLHQTPRGRRECAIRIDQGHTLHFEEGI